jgi:hypothetical protein
MSHENVEVVRRGNAAFNRGDYEAAAESWHPDVEYRTQATAKPEEADVEAQPTSLYDRLGGIYSIATNCAGLDWKLSGLSREECELGRITRAWSRAELIRR